MDLASGELFTDGEVERQAKQNQRPGPPNQTQQRQRLALCVWETQNVLLVRPLDQALRDGGKAEASLEYALKRGIEQAFQLEERELGVERVGRGERRALLFYEAAEGGLGVLRRLVEEPDALATVTREALRVCHYAEDGRDLKPECAQACYECLLSYTNQSDALLLDRRLVLDVLLKLAHCRVEPRVRGVSRSEHLEALRARTQSEFERQVLDFLAEGGYRLPDDAQKSLQEPRCIADFFYEPNVAVFCDGPPHEHPDQRRVDETIRRELVTRGYRVVVVRQGEDLGRQMTNYPDVFGHGVEVRN